MDCHDTHVFDARLLQHGSFDETITVATSGVERLYMYSDDYLSARHSTASMSWSLRMSNTYVLTKASTVPSGMWSAACSGLP